MDMLKQLGLILPDYGASTIANIPATIARLLGVESPMLAPLRSDLWQPLLETREIKRVLLLLVDGMGQNLINKIEAETAWLKHEALISGTITSVFPSTTVNALSCLWTGAAPAQHGLVGLELFFPQMGVVGQMLALTPSFAWWPDALVRGGLDPHAFLQAPGFAETLAHEGIETYAVKHYSLVNSSLSKMHSRGVKEGIGIVTGADMMWQLRNLLEQDQDRKTFISAYWAAVDTLSHRHGFDHPAVASELGSFLHLFRTELLERLSPGARRNTVVILTADHGLINTPPEKKIFIEDHPQLQEKLLMRATGEPHTSYLYVRYGQKQAVIDYVNQTLGHAATAIDADTVMRAGLLGPPPFTPELARRIGDVIVTCRGGYSLLSRNGDEFLDKLVGRHGGLTRDEMEVPYFSFYLS